MEPLRISNSELQVYKDCRRKWHLTYYRKLLKPEPKIGPLAIGIRVHEVLGTYYTPGGTIDSALEILENNILRDRDLVSAYELTKFDKECTLVRVMCEGYFDWAEETGIDQYIEITETESEIEYPLRIRDWDIILQGKRDAIGFDIRTQISSLWDHKTCVSLDDPMIDLNEQARTYLLLQRLNGGTVVQNVSWNLLRKVLRSGKAQPPFYRRDDLYISEDELRRFWSRLQGTLQDLVETREKLDSGESHYSACYPRPSRDCSWKCSYRTVCPMLDTEGEHSELILSNAYEVGDPYERYKDTKEI